MLNRLSCPGGTTQSVATLESIEQRVMLDATYLYNESESILKLPSDRLGGLGVNGNITVLDDLNNDGVREFSASGAVRVQKKTQQYFTDSVVQVFDGKSGSVIYSLGFPGSYYYGN